MISFRTVGGYEEFRDEESGESVKIHRLHACLDNDPSNVFNAQYTNIHHLNTIPWDNRAENLLLLRARYHRNLHGNMSWEQMVCYYNDNDVSDSEMQTLEKYYDTLTKKYLRE